MAKYVSSDPASGDAKTRLKETRVLLSFSLSLSAINENRPRLAGSLTCLNSVQFPQAFSHSSRIVSLLPACPSREQFTQSTKKRNETKGKLLVTSFSAVATVFWTLRLPSYSENSFLQIVVESVSTTRGKKRVSEFVSTYYGDFNECNEWYCVHYVFTRIR